jgi:hypothetical protein
MEKRIKSMKRETEIESNKINDIVVDSEEYFAIALHETINSEMITETIDIENQLDKITIVEKVDSDDEIEI